MIFLCAILINASTKEEDDDSSLSSTSSSDSLNSIST